ncbi:transcriptional regulator, MerR family [Quadrisphaera granulorum]|uniref:MerR family transcriptional regulator n=1 Tax=Quadrisphaera granulorum TaxID=317664 RepID=A0A316ABZ7_9ACTN|nr:MerR family transcriptional regulator [Quadrisphaera granulorum]PWJ54560.1 MerR family transcriptional regulator [Quadrisphaera granulorum]SZE95922.1 transcriptional regulator, MerR family [Quadrisphaera granulorum]
MSTDALIEQLLAAPPEVGRSVVEALHQLLDDSMLDADDDAPRSVAEAAALVGLTAHTLRYYEQQGLVRPARSPSGHRLYRAADLRRLVFLTRMRLSGMTMHDLTRYVRLVEQGEHTVDERRRIMLEQRERILRRMRELSLALEVTEYKIELYGGSSGA